MSLNQKNCNSSTASTPLQQVFDALLKQQQSIEDLTKTMQAMRSVEPNPMNQSRNHQTAKPKRKCFNCGKEGHIARYCRSKLPEKGPSAESGNTKQWEVSAVKLTPPVTMSLVTGGPTLAYLKKYLAEMKFLAEPWEGARLQMWS